MTKDEQVLLPNNSGNSYLDTIANLATVATPFVGLYGSFMNSKNVVELARIQKGLEPIQTIPEHNISSFADYISDPIRIRKIGTYGVAGTLSAFLIYYIYKKI